MHLKALKLHGFKSFADPTTLGFDHGVTAVVGPNGCGKSNIADAIRWVLGEQSAKALRGGRMQDVIFEGTDTRRPSQMCEVSLLLSNCEKQLGSQFHEIEIMRRVHRDGQSEYFFNNIPCRLKDIHKLFMDTGVGRMSYSIMAQGQIDQILSSKPEERRAVFEEAAGITKYKSLRRDALANLARTEANLARVSDIIGEVGRQIGSLRRQASKALRYKRFSHRLRHLALAHSGHQHGRISATLADLGEQAAKLRADSEARRAHYSQQQQGLEEKKASRASLNQRVQEAGQAAFDLRTERDQTLNAAALAQIKRTALLERLEAARAALGEHEMQLRDLTAQAGASAQDKQLQLSLLGTSEVHLQEIVRQVAVADGALASLEQELQQAKFQLLQTESTLARLRADCSGYEVDQKTSVHRHETLVAELDGVRRQQTAAAQTAAGLDARVQEAHSGKTRVQQEQKDAEQAVAARTREFRDAQRRLTELDRQLAKRTAQIQLLQKLRETWKGFGEGAKAVLQGRLDHALNGAPRPVPLMDGLHIPAEHARAVEVLLGAAAEAVTVADLATAQTILAQLEATQSGAICLRVGEISDFGFQISDSQTTQTASPPPAPGQSAIPNPQSEIRNPQSAIPPIPLPAGLTPVNNILRASASAPAHPALSLLSACYIADDLHAFLDFWKQNPSFPFLAVATRKGECADRRGLVSGGAARENPDGIIQREINLRETTKALADDQKSFSAQKKLADSINARIAEAEAALGEKRQELLAFTQQAAAIQAEQRNARHALDDITGRLRRLEADAASVEAARDEAHARWQKAQAQLAGAESRLARGRDGIQEMDTRLAALRAERDARRESLNAARLAASDQRSKVDYLDRGLADMERRRAELHSLLIQRQQEIELWTQQTKELENETASGRARAAALEETIAVAQQQVERIRLQFAEIERQITAVEGTQDALRLEAEKAGDECSRCEVKLAESRARADFLKEEVEREFQADIATLDWKLLLWHAADDPPGIDNLDLDDDDDGGQKPEDKDQMPDPPDQPDQPDQSDQPNQPDQTGQQPAAAAPPPKRRRRKPRQKGDPTPADLAALDATNWEQVRADTAALRQRINSMGDVNLVAIEEYRSLKQRHDFLKHENDDIVNSRAALLKSIDEINATSTKQFQITFEQIKKNFDYTFSKLFGGGRATLDLVQADDPLESGIEIVAQPPGTKLKGITLLSGGQKTLTAVALLFALYMVKPSPFCLLDELDAPLDEPNIGRFTGLLADFTNESQFILITHNKGTVEAANAIYGVTMEERGVSKTVSMRFNKEQGAAVAQPAGVLAPVPAPAQSSGGD